MCCCGFDIGNPLTVLQTDDLYSRILNITETVDEDFKHLLQFTDLSVHVGFLLYMQNAIAVNSD